MGHRNNRMVGNSSKVVVQTMECMVGNCMVHIQNPWNMVHRNSQNNYQRMGNQRSSCSPNVYMDYNMENSLMDEEGNALLHFKQMIFQDVC